MRAALRRATSEAQLARPRQLALVLCALLAACTSDVPAVPFCLPREQARPEPSPSCYYDDDTRGFENALRAVLEPVAGPLLVRVEFDYDAVMDGVCAERNVGPGQWQARARIGEQVRGLPVELRAPDCLAETRLEFNRIGAARAQIDEAIRGCEREAEGLARNSPTGGVRDRTIRGYDDPAEWVGPDTPVTVERGRASRLYLECIAIQQERRGELWVFVPFDDSWRVFVPTEAAQPRRKTRLACTLPELATGPGKLPSTGIAGPGGERKLLACMREQGWEMFP